MAGAVDNEEKEFGKKGSERATPSWPARLLCPDFHGDLCDFDEPLELRAWKLACDIVAYLLRCYTVRLPVASVCRRFFYVAAVLFLKPEFTHVKRSGAMNVTVNHFLPYAANEESISSGF